MPQVRQNKLIPILIMLVGLIGGYFYYSQGGLGEIVVSGAGEGVKDDLAKFKGLQLNFSVLQNGTYTFLQVFGELPVSPGTPGKRDFFAPF